MKDETPIISIICLCYNHGRYIRKALEGFVNQEIDFPFEIIVHDDASTDNSVEILREFEALHPSLFRNIYQEENQYSKEKGRVTKITLQAARGKYIAFCEGDDYWTDRLKLQMQVAYLENNPEYVLSHTDCDFYLQSNNSFQYGKNLDYNQSGQLSKKELFFEIISARMKVRTPTVVVRQSALAGYIPDYRFVMGDTPLWLYLSQIGKFHYVHKSTAVYRVAVGSSSRSSDLLKQLVFEISAVDMRFHFITRYGYEVPESLKKRYFSALQNYYLLNGSDLKSEAAEYLSVDEMKELDKIRRRSRIYNQIVYLKRYPSRYLRNVYRMLNSSFKTIY